MAKNLADMTDAELDAMDQDLAGQENALASAAPASPKTSHYESMSDDELDRQDAMLAAMEQRATAMQPAAEVAPEPEKIPTYPGEIGPPQPTMLQGAIQQFHNIADPLMQQAVDFGNKLNDETYFVDNSTHAMQDSNSVKLNGAIVGGLKGTDALLNLLAQGLKDPGVNLPPINLESLYAGTPWAKESETLAPNLYGMAKTIGEFTAPLPALGNMVGGAAKLLPKIPLLEQLAAGVTRGNIIPNMLNEGLQGGAINAALEGGQQIKENRPDPLAILGAGATGVAAGAGLSGGIRGGVKIAGAGMDLGRRGINNTLRKLYRPSEADRLRSEGAVDARLGLKGEVVPPEQAPAEPQMSELDQALDAVVKARTERELIDAQANVQDIHEGMYSKADRRTPEGKKQYKRLQIQLDAATAKRDEIIKAELKAQAKAAKAAAQPAQPQQPAPLQGSAQHDVQAPMEAPQLVEQIDTSVQPVENPQQNRHIEPEQPPAEPPAAEPLKGGVEQNIDGEWRRPATDYGRKETTSPGVFSLDDAIAQNHIPPEARDAFTDAADAKLASDKAKYQFQTALRDFIQLHDGDPRLTQESKRTSPDQEVRIQSTDKTKLNKEREKILDDLKNLLSDGEKAGQPAHIRGLSEHGHGPGKNDLPGEPVALSGDFADDVSRVRELQANFDDAAADYSAAKKRVEPFILSAQESYIQQTGDEVAHFKVNAPASQHGPTGRQVNVLLQQEKQHLNRIIPDTVPTAELPPEVTSRLAPAEAERTAKQIVDEIENILKVEERAEGKGKTVRTFFEYGRKKSKAILSGAAAITSLLQGSKAQAADLAAQAIEHSHSLFFNGTTDTAAHAAAAAIVAAVGHIGAKAIKNSDSWLAHALFTNTADCAKNISNIIADLDKAAGKKAGENVRTQIFHIIGQVNQARFGVHFDDQIIREQALNMMRQGDISLQRVKGMVGPAVPIPKGTTEPTAAQLFESLNLAQRKAVYRQHEGGLKIRDVVTKEIAKLDGHIDRLERAAKRGDKTAEAKLEELRGSERFQFGKAALHTILQSVSPNADKTLAKNAGKAIRNLQSSFYTSAFELNPAHHLNNLTDHLIAGLSATGPINMTKANAALMVNPTVKAHYRSSGLITGIGAEAQEIKALHSGHGNKGLEDFQSDKYNADRVALASWFQFYNLKANKSRFEKLGISEDQFIKDMLEGDVTKMSPEQADLNGKAWGHMAETLSDVMGADVFHLNKSTMANALNLTSFGIFMNQPSRMARQLVNYMAEGNIKGTVSLIGMTALLGGSAAISPTVKGLWGTVDPQGLSNTSAALDRYSIPGLLGRPAANKLDIDVFWPVFASNLPIAENMKRSFYEQPQKVIDKTIEYVAEASTNDKKAKELLPALFKCYATAGSVMAGTAAFGAVLGTGGRVPQGILGLGRIASKGLRAQANAMEGGKPIYSPSILDGGRPETVKFKDVNVHPWEQLFDQLFPGRDKWEHERAMYIDMAKRMKWHADQVLGLEKISRGTPLNSFFKEMSSHGKGEKPAYNRVDKSINRSFTSLVTTPPQDILEAISGKGKTK